MTPTQIAHQVDLEQKQHLKNQRPVRRAASWTALALYSVAAYYAFVALLSL